MYYHKLFSYALISITLLFSIESYANIVDGGEIQFNGFVTDESPKWIWQISTPTQNWDVDTANARTENGQLFFNLRDKGSLPFLEGRLYEMAEYSGLGFTPEISFRSNGEPLQVISGGGTTAQQFRASVPVRNHENGDVVGRLSFTLNQGIAIATDKQNESLMIPSGISLLNGQTVTQVNTETLPRELKNRLSSLLLMVRNFGDGVTTANNNQVISQNVLMDGRLMNFALSYASTISDFELQLPTENTPDTWQATLNVMVTVQ